MGDGIIKEKATDAQPGNERIMWKEMVCVCRQKLSEHCPVAFTMSYLK